MLLKSINPIKTDVCIQNYVHSTYSSYSEKDEIIFTLHFLTIHNLQHLSENFKIISKSSENRVETSSDVYVYSFFCMLSIINIFNAYKINIKKQQ